MQNFLIIVNNLHSTILIHKACNGWKFPSIYNTQKDESDVAVVCQKIKQKFNISGLVIDFYTIENTRTYLFETHDYHILANYNWASLNKIDIFMGRNQEYINIISRYRNQLNSNKDVLPILWYNRNWLSHIITVTSKLLHLNQTIPPENLLQIRSWCLSTTIRIHYNFQTFFFKALNRLVAHEVLLTPFLYKNFPNLIPEVLAIDEEFNYIITEDLNGAHLDTFQDFNVHIQALKSYSHFQLNMINKVHELKELSMPTRDINWLRTNIDLILQDECLLKSGMNGGLNDSEIASLKSLSNDFKDLCTEYEKLCLPYTIEHGDLHSKNIIIKQKDSFYIDWSHSSISIPFIGYYNFIYEASKKYISSQLKILKKAYIEEWYIISTKQIIDKALKLSEPLYFLVQAVIHYEIYHNLEQKFKREVAGAPAYFLKSLLKNYKKLNNMCDS